MFFLVTVSQPSWTNKVERKEYLTKYFAYINGVIYEYNICI